MPYRPSQELPLASTQSFLLVAGLLVFAVTESPHVPSSGAVMALIGMFAAGLTLAATCVKHFLATSADQIQHTIEKRMELESEHNRIRENQAEDRLRLDAALKVVELIGSTKDEAGGMRQRAGALFTLAWLGQLELALALLYRMWPNGEVDNATAMLLLARGLNSDEALQLDAAEILISNVGQITCSGYHYVWPSGFAGDWDPTLCLRAREILLETMVEIILAIPRHQWAMDYLRGLLGMIYKAVIKDPHYRIQIEASMILRELLAANIVPRALFFRDGDVFVPQMQRDVDAVITTLFPQHPIDGFRDRIRILSEQLRQWRGTKVPAASRRRDASSTGLTPVEIATRLVTVSPVTGTGE